MGVWIETRSLHPYLLQIWRHTLYGCVDWNKRTDLLLNQSKGHTLYGCVDWNSANAELISSSSGHTLYGCVDWNLSIVETASKATCHTLYGCVDWNRCQSILLCLLRVTPCMGVWIETYSGEVDEYMDLVTPCMGVWIETMSSRINISTRLGHTLYGCVDWNKHVGKISRLINVTPCMGVWIETINTNMSVIEYRSHPVWVCGLKLFCSLLSAVEVLSHPVWVCGLKLSLNKGSVHRIQSHTLYGCVDWNISTSEALRLGLVTPCMGVWIETVSVGKSKKYLNVTPCMGVWIETEVSRPYIRIKTSHTLYGRVDWNRKDAYQFARKICHTLYGCVDWNCQSLMSSSSFACHTLYGCVDWNLHSPFGMSPLASHTLYGCVDWNTSDNDTVSYELKSHPSWVCGLKHNFNNLIVCQYRSRWFFIHYQQRNWQNRAIFLYLTPKLSGISGKIFKFAFKYNIL